MLAEPSVTYIALSALASSEDVELMGRVIAQDLKQVCSRRIRDIARGAQVVPDVGHLRRVRCATRGRSARRLFPSSAASSHANSRVDAVPAAVDRSAQSVPIRRTAYCASPRIAGCRSNRSAIRHATLQRTHQPGRLRNGLLSEGHDQKSRQVQRPSKSATRLRQRPSGAAFGAQPSTGDRSHLSRDRTACMTTTDTAETTPPAPRIVGHGPPSLQLPKEWWRAGFGRQEKAIIGALVAAWTGLPFALWLAVAGFFFGAIIGFVGSAGDPQPPRHPRRHIWWPGQRIARRPTRRPPWNWSADSC